MQRLYKVSVFGNVVAYGNVADNNQFPEMTRIKSPTC